jgi:hypothetical protein
MPRALVATALMLAACTPDHTSGATGRREIEIVRTNSSGKLVADPSDAVTVSSRADRDAPDDAPVSFDVSRGIGSWDLVKGGLVVSTTPESNGRRMIVISGGNSMMSGTIVAVEVDARDPTRILRLGVRSTGGCIPTDDKWLGKVSGTISNTATNHQEAGSLEVRFDLTCVDTIRGEPGRHAEPYVLRGHVPVDLSAKESSYVRDVGKMVMDEFAAIGN